MTGRNSGQCTISQVNLKFLQQIKMHMVFVLTKKSLAGVIERMLGYGLWDNNP